MQEPRQTSANGCINKTNTKNGENRTEDGFLRSCVYSAPEKQPKLGLTGLIGQLYSRSAPVIGCLLMTFARLSITDIELLFPYLSSPCLQLYGGATVLFFQVETGYYQKPNICTLYAILLMPIVLLFIQDSQFILLIKISSLRRTSSLLRLIKTDLGNDDYL